MLRINYTNSGVAVPDYECFDFVLRNYKLGGNIDTSSSLVIYCARALICRKDIPSNDIEFYFNGDYVGRANKSGNLDKWPDGFCDVYDEVLDVLIGIIR